MSTIISSIVSLCPIPQEIKNEFEIESLDPQKLPQLLATHLKETEIDQRFPFIWITDQIDIPGPELPYSSAILLSLAPDQLEKAIKDPLLKEKWWHYYTKGHRLWIVGNSSSELKQWLYKARNWIYQQQMIQNVHVHRNDAVQKATQIKQDQKVTNLRQKKAQIARLKKEIHNQVQILRFAAKLMKAKSRLDATKIKRKFFPKYIPPQADKIREEVLALLNLKKETEKEERLKRNLLKRLPSTLLMVNNQYELIDSNLKKDISQETRKKFCYQVYFKRNTPCPGCSLGEKTFFEINLDDGKKRKVFSHMLQINASNPKIFVNFYQDPSSQQLNILHLSEKSKFDELGILSASLIHEINNPLNIILSYTQLALGTLANENKNWEQLKDDLKAIEATVKRCRDLVNQLLIFTRIRFSQPSQSMAELVTAAWAVGALESTQHTPMNPQITSHLEDAFVNDALTILIMHFTEQLSSLYHKSLTGKLPYQAQPHLQIDQLKTAIRIRCYMPHPVSKKHLESIVTQSLGSFHLNFGQLRFIENTKSSVLGLEIQFPRPDRDDKF